MKKCHAETLISYFFFFLFFSILGRITGCTVLHPKPVEHPDIQPPDVSGSRSENGICCSGGGLFHVNNAARLTGLLRKQGLDAYYFVFDSGLYKVRFGNFETESAAKKKAESLKSSSVIETYYIVSPQEYTISLQAALGADYVREAVSKTAESFLGIPYLWGVQPPRMDSIAVV